MSSELSNGLNDDDFIVVWIEEDNIDTKHSVSTRFGHATHAIHTFDDVEQCIDFVRTAKNESIFLIISELSMHKFIFELHEFPQLHSIYIISSHMLSSDDENPTIHKKVRGAFSDVLSLFEHLTQDIRVAEATITPMSIFNSSLTSCDYFNAPVCSFIFSHLLKEIILEHKNNNRLQHQFIEFCREKYANNEGELKIINEFDDHYKNHSPAWCSRDISLHFAQHSLDKDNIVPVIFEIHIDTSIQSTPFASLDKIGYFPTETEMLFSMHSIFRIGDIEDMENHIWNIRLTLINDDDPHLRSLSNFIQTEIQGSNTMLRLGSFMLKVHEWDKAKSIFEFVLSDATPNSKNELAYIEDCFGKIYDKKNDWKKSLKHYQRSLDIKRTYLTDEDPQLASTHTHLGSVLGKMGKFDSAMEQYRYVLDIELKSSVPDKKQLGMCYMSIGDLLRQLSHFEEARKNLKNALKIQLDILPFTHPDLAKTRTHLFDACYSMGDYFTALEQAKALLRIAQKSYPANHFQIAIAHNNISATLDKLERYEEALEEVEKA
ncbi:unnamed protein product, partial [Rotaria sp. Silwood1]